MTVIPFRNDSLALPSQLTPGRQLGRIWVTDDQLGQDSVYAECVADFDRSGRWPVLIPHDERFSLSGEDWIVDRGFGSPALERARSADPAEVLSGWWAEPCCQGRCLDPYGAEFPGLARKSPARIAPRAEAASLGALLSSVSQVRLGLVAVDRPADVPAGLGWNGMLNQTPDVGALSAVLRSWEDRFGAVLVALGFDSLTLSVAAPPTTPARALALAAEHRAFCLDNFPLQPGDLRAFSVSLLRARSWRFWWD